MRSAVSLSDMSRFDRDPLVHLENAELMPLPPPLESPAKDHEFSPSPRRLAPAMNAGLTTRAP